MDNKIKKILAKEGLIFLFISFLTYFLTYLYFRLPVGIINYKFAERDFLLSSRYVLLLDTSKNLLIIYLFYLLIRFVVWAIIVLKQRS